MLKHKGATLFRRCCAGVSGLVLAAGLFSASAQRSKADVSRPTGRTASDP